MKVLFIGGWAIPERSQKSLVSQIFPASWQVDIWPLDGSRPGWPDQDTATDTCSLLAGWSLGAMLAVMQAQDREKPVVTLACGPQFAPDPKRQAWLKAFSRGFCSDPEAALRRFALLMCKGGPVDRALIRTLQSALCHDLAVRMEGLQQGLNALATLNVEEAWQAVKPYRLSWAFEHDAIYPPDPKQDAVQMLPGPHWPIQSTCHSIRKTLEARYGG